MKRASVTDAKNGLSALLDRVRHGESILIEDRGIPVAQLNPVTGTGGGVASRFTGADDSAGRMTP